MHGGGLPWQPASDAFVSAGMIMIRQEAQGTSSAANLRQMTAPSMQISMSEKHQVKAIWTIFPSAFWHSQLLKVLQAAQNLLCLG